MCIHYVICQLTYVFQRYCVNTLNWFYRAPVKVPMNQLNPAQITSPQHVPTFPAKRDILDLLTLTTESSERNLMRSEISTGQKPEVVQLEQAQSLSHSQMETKKSDIEKEKDIADLIITELTQTGGNENKTLEQSKTVHPVNSSTVVKPLGDISVSIDSIKPGTVH